MTKEETLDLVFKMLQDYTKNHYNQNGTQQSFVARNDLYKDKIILVRDCDTPPVIIELDIKVREIDI